MSVRPNVYVGIGFGARAYDFAPTWTPLSTRLYAAALERGKEARLLDYSPGQATVTVKNLDGRLLPNSTASPYRVSSYRNAVMASNPCAYFRLGEASGTQARNEITAPGNGNPHGTYAGAPTLGVAGLVANDTNTAVTLGTNLTPSARITCSGSAGLWPFAPSFYPSTPFVSRYGWTIEAWVNLPAAPAATSFIFHGDQGGTRVLDVTVLTSGKIRVNAPYGAANAQVNFDAAAAMTFGTKHHIAVTYQAHDQIMSFYVDGKLTDSFYNIVKLYDFGTLGWTTAFVIGGSAAGTNAFYGTLDEVAFYNTTLSATAIATHFAASGSTTALIPGVQLFVGEGFPGRLMLETPAMYWDFNESTGPPTDIIQSVQLVPEGALSTRNPTFGQVGSLGRAVLFDGRKQALYSGIAHPSTGLGGTAGSFYSTLMPQGSTGVSVVAIVRIDEKGVARKQHIIVGRSTSDKVEHSLGLSYTSLNQIRLFVETTAAEKSTTVVACTTGWHFVVATVKKGSKPVITLDGARTSGPAALTGGWLGSPKRWFVGGLVSSSTGSTGGKFKGMIDDVAITARTAISSGSAASLLAEYQNKWKPGRIGFRGHATPQGAFAFDFPKNKDAQVTITAQDWTGRLSQVAIPPTAPSSSTKYQTTGVPHNDGVIWQGYGDTPGSRIKQILRKVRMPVRGMQEIDIGASLLLPTTWNVNAFASASQVAMSENGALYARKEGAIRFDARKRIFLDTRMQVPVSTYTDSLVAGSLGFANPQTGYGSLIRNDVVMTNTTYTTELQSTESQNSYGMVTTNRLPLNLDHNDMIEQGRLVLKQYSTAMYAPLRITVYPHGTTQDYTAYCYRELRDRIRIKQLAPGTTRRSTADVTIEKEVCTIAKHQNITTYSLDSAQRNGLIPSTNLLVLDTTKAGQKLDSGRLGF